MEPTNPCRAYLQAECHEHSTAGEKLSSVGAQLLTVFHFYNNQKLILLNSLLESLTCEVLYIKIFNCEGILDQNGTPFDLEIYLGLTF